MSTFPTLLRRAGTSALRPLTLIEVFFRRSDAAGDIFPTDTTFGVVSGADARRLVLIGEAGMLSLGVLSHDIGVAGFVARRLAAIERRGVHWNISTAPGSRIRDARRLIESTASELASADAVVLMIGISDVLTFTRVGEWKDELDAALTSLAARLPRGSGIGVAEIPPLDNAGSLSRLARVAAGLRAQVVNDCTRRVVAGHPTAFTIPFPEELTRTLWVPRSREQQYRNTYTVWGRDVAEAIAPRLRRTPRELDA